MDYIVAIIFGCAVFAVLMCGVAPFNRLIARMLGAPSGMSFSAYLWFLETGTGRMHWLGAVLRPVVDWIFRVSDKQEDHCFSAFTKQGS